MLGPSFRRCTFFFFNDTATTEIYTLSLHDALPIFLGDRQGPGGSAGLCQCCTEPGEPARRSEEHTSELQSQSNHVCRLLLEKKNASVQITALHRVLAFPFLADQHPLELLALSEKAN